MRKPHSNPPMRHKRTSSLEDSKYGKKEIRSPKDSKKSKFSNIKTKPVFNFHDMHTEESSLSVPQTKETIVVIKEHSLPPIERTFEHKWVEVYTFKNFG